MTKRTKYDVIFDILRVCEDGCKKVDIFYEARLNHTMLNDYIKELMDKELLATEEGSTIYRTTGKGLEFLKYYNSALELIKLE